MGTHTSTRSTKMMPTLLPLVALVLCLFVQRSNAQDIKCTVEHCTPQFFECELEKGGVCKDALQCSRKCASGPDPDNKAPGCCYLCEMTYGKKSTKFTNLLNCMYKHKCMKEYPKDGTCLATDKDAVQNLTKLEQIKGDWWVLKGINCGQLQKGNDTLNPTPGLKYPGGYDWYPCQHERFVPSNGHDYPHPTTPWVNNITYCGGKKDACATDIIDTVANITLSSPGVVHHLYTDAPMLPQEEFWRVVSWPHPDYVFVIWCGSTPVVPYNGGIVLSRAARSMAGMPAYVEANFKATAARFNVSWDQMCPSTNVGCP